MNEKVLIACEGAGLIDIDDLHELQGDLKSLSEEDGQKLENEILTTGVAFPFRAWNDGKKWWIIGGHQAKRILKRLRERGVEVPPVPYSVVHAKSKKEAMRRVLQDISQYGKIDRQGMYQFMHMADFSMAEIKTGFSLPDFNVPSFAAEYFDETDPAKQREAQGATEYGEGEFQGFKLTCPKCGYHYESTKKPS